MSFVPFSQGLRVLYRSLKAAVQYKQPQGLFFAGQVLVSSLSLGFSAWCFS